MTLIERSIKSPVAVAVGVILLVLFGLISIFRIPIQLTPDVQQPRITVETRWPGASPQEIEREIVDRQEEQLKSVDGLVRMTSESRDSVGSVVLEFPVGTDIDAASLRVANKLDQVQEAPQQAEEPVISNVDPGDNAIAWITLRRLEGNEQDINSYRDLCEDVIQPAFERVQGVAKCNIFGGTERQLLVTVDPQRLSAMRITVAQVANALRRENRNISGGDFDEGKRRYIVRTLGEFSEPADLMDVVVAYRDEIPVYLRDVAEVEMTYQEPDFTVRQLGNPSIAMNCQRATGANVLETMKGIQAELDRLNEDLLRPQRLELRQVYDETIYIYSAINLVRQNIVLGGLLAIVVLSIFLRSKSSVFIVSTAIPISIVGTFLAMKLLGRNINVISLAGMSFAVGMVVDNSIVVLENIFRHRQMGKSRGRAALEGAREVWGAVLASSLTTMAVFIPILFMEEEIGQLYRDIALAISSAVALSMLVAITVIPTLSAKIIGGGADDKAKQERRGPLHAASRRLDRLAGRFSEGVSSFVYRACGRTWTRVAITAVLTTLSVLGARALVPPAEYLPEGNQNLVFGILLPPPGYNLDQLSGIGKHIEQQAMPHFPSYAGEPREEIREPAFENFFFVAQGRNVFMGSRAEDPSRVSELVPVLREALVDVPGMIAIIRQTSLFGRSVGQGRNVDIELTGTDLPRLMGLAGRVFGQCMGLFPGAQIQPIPSLDLGNPEVNVLPDRLKAAKLGLSAEEVGIAVDVLMDGRKIDDFKYLGQEVDLRMEGREEFASRSQDIARLPIATPTGKLVDLGSIAEVRVTTGPEQINHIEQRRAVTIRVVPPNDLPLETAMQRIESDILTPMREQGLLNDLTQAELTGTADDLDVTRRALQWNFLLAVVIAYLLMAALFESFLHPLVIMFSVPLAAVGGFIGLSVVNTLLGQNLDTLTMLGFIILVGTVINNAILIVHQSLNHIRDEGMEARDAIRDAVRTRIRPIFMSMTTSVLGMLPLVVFSGAGSELYRGIGSVVIGGFVVSTIFTLILVPTLFSLVYGAQTKLSVWIHRLREGGEPA